MLKAVFFDLDGTLLPLNEDIFIKKYFGLLCKRMTPLGYNPEKLVEVIYAGTMAMYKNDGSSSNEDVFWNYFTKIYGEEKLKDKCIIDGFYTKEFSGVKEVCGDNPLAKKIVDFCKDNNLKVILSTNPIFPKIGTLTRMSFIGLNENDFDDVTAYEDCRFCKPNPKYFQDLLVKHNLKPEEVILFGNNTYEDGECALACGIKCYLVGDYIIENQKAIHSFERLQMNEVIDVIKSYL